MGAETTASIATAAFTALSVLVVFLSNRPRRARLREELEIYKGMMEIGALDNESPELVMLRAMISKDLALLVFPYKRRYVAFAAAFTIGAAVIAGILSHEFIRAFGASVPTVSLCILASLALGVLFGKLPMAIIETQLDAAVKTVQRLERPNPYAENDAKNKGPADPEERNSAEDGE